MKKLFFIISLIFLGLSIKAQNGEYHVRIHGQETKGTILDSPVFAVDSIYMRNNKLKAKTSNNLYSFDFSEIDSITFPWVSTSTGDIVYITYNGTDVEIVNPYSSSGVVITASEGKVSVTSTSSENITYCLSGTSNPGRFAIESSTTPTIMMNGVNLTNPTGKAMDLTCEAGLIMQLADGTSNSLCDGTESDKKAAFMSNNDLLVQGEGTLTVTGLVQHAIRVKGQFTMNSGNIVITSSVQDGVHTDALRVQGGNITVESCGDDGITSELDAYIYGGTINVTSDSEDINALSADSTLVINDGNINITVTGVSSNCIKADKELTINGGTFVLNHSGDVSKGIKSNSDINFTGGDITIVSSGSTVLEQVTSGSTTINSPSYCTAIKSDTDIIISGGTFNITLPTSNQGGKSISADGNITISGGDFTITTNGAGAAYTVSGNTKDSYTSSCLKCDGNMVISAGNFTLSSTGAGGKGINVEGTLVIGTSGGNNDDLNLNVATSGNRITVTSGGGWGGGGDYANPKAIKSQGNMTINSGNITINCTQTTEGGECIESKSTLTINGGNIEAYSKYDDAFNASSNITINGGTIYAHSDNNDGIDSNGTMFINGGFNISNGARAPEEGFDCDNNQFKITGSTSIGTGGGTSSPTSSVCTQPSIKINTQPGYAIQILNSSGTVICTYKCPTFTGGGGGGGGTSGMVMLFTDPQLSTGQTYTIKYNGTISGGTNTNGYYTGNVTYSGGSTATVTLNSMYSQVNAGGSGW